MTPGNVQYHWLLCLDCSRQLWGRKQPTEAYARTTAKLLLGTIYQETQGEVRRQYGVNVVGNTGGFGVVQLEWPTIKECLKKLDKEPALARRLAMWVFRDRRYPLDWYKSWGMYRKPAILWMLRVDDRLAVALARVNYARFPQPIPAGTQLHAPYYKRYWNTEFGKGTIRQYLDNWLKYCQRLVEDWELGNA